MSNDNKTQSSVRITIDFEQLTYGELRKFVKLTADYGDDEFVDFADDRGDPSGLTAYVNAESL